MKVLITGAGGFLGKHLVQFLSKIECTVHNLGNTKVKNCIYHSLDNILDEKTISRVVSEIEPDYIFHLAGTTNTSSNITDCFSVNTFYAKYLLNAVKKVGLELHTKIMIVGSAAEYGPIREAQLPISEVLITNPRTMYGISKLAQTHLALSWQNSTTPLVIVRPFNIIGPIMPKHLALGSFFQQIIEMDKRGTLRTGNLNTERDFIDINDVTHLMWKLINNPKAYGEIINLCRGRPVSMSDIVVYLINHSKKSIELKIEEERIRKNDIKVHYGDNTKLKSLIGDYEFIPWKKTISSAIEYYEL